jgi:hypothetical protein
MGGSADDTSDYSFSWYAVTLAFVITACWDVVLRGFSTGYVRGFGIEELSWVAGLRPYFEAHTPLAAACIAGVVGAATYCIISTTFRHIFLRAGRRPGARSTVIWFVLYTMLVSGAVGIPMRYTGAFPHLEKYYYQPLGILYSTATDVFSGIVVMVSMQAVLLVIRSIRARLS